ncbi:TlyA family RNA methyltransferase [Marinobacterium rhizophilum]|uniref:TlyA family RNA methyltransferase n=1 Tax=Marinobacterium rhizophilum TaxID=420402 RepID=UPI000379A021|nr:TlyA family RNA methyltransferase [Marinobacterium rhizophilum]
MQRIDMILVTRALASSRTHAQRLIRDGRVQAHLNNAWQCIAKPGLKLDPDTELRVSADPQDRFVSRGALKLLGALEQLQLDPTGMVAIDVGQSTGGFTDCLLQHGAAAVVGIEVGHDQLDARLRADPRVTCLEGVNARALDPLQLLPLSRDSAGFDLAVMDVSFISQTKILPSLVPLIRAGGRLISLVKPQFEVGRSGIGKGGIVRDESLYTEVEATIRRHCESLGLCIQHYMPSPITGGDGNREFLLIGVKTESR